MWRFGVCVLLLIVVIQIEQIQSQEMQNFNDAGSDCGISNFRIGQRINGGEEANAHDWPWQALLVCRTSKTKTAICGGTIISNQWVLTAAHCVQNPNYSYRSCQVYLGAHKLMYGPPDKAEKRFAIRNRVLHYQYMKNNTVAGYDIALIKLNGSVTYSPEIKPICMPFGLQEVNQNSTCYTTGWGRYYLQRTTKTLRQIQMPIKESGYCGFTESSRSPVICAGEFRRQENVCNGDSGGPLVCLEGDGRWTLRGVVSMVDSRCLEVTSYSKVAAFEKWMKSGMRMNLRTRRAVKLKEVQTKPEWQKRRKPE